MTIMLREGRPWSGHERHCAYLNTGGERFACISAVSGMDFLDDGRSAAVVDWDLDGDLDLWLGNRTGPRLRFMRNDLVTDNHFLDVRLVGQSCNRDAVGARVELHVGGERPRKLTKTLHAGAEFLTQSSKWVHFGLEDSTRIERLVVRWPGGGPEEFSGLEADRRYELHQGTGEARPSTAAATAPVAQLTPSRPQPPRAPSRARRVLGAPVPMPAFTYTDLAGERLSSDDYRGSPLLINLWATWCVPCRGELKDFAEREERLRAAGLNVLALNMDEATDEQGGEDGKAKDLLESLKFPFDAGIATPEFLDDLGLVRWVVLNKTSSSLSIPTSLLLDSDGFLTAIYTGPVPVDELLGDVASLEEGSGVTRNTVPPLPGRWRAAPAHPGGGRIAMALFDRGNPHQAKQYLKRVIDRYTKLAERDDRHHIGIHRQTLHAAHSLLGMYLAANQSGSKNQDAEVQQAIVHLEEALRLNPDAAQVHRALGVALAAQGKTSDAFRHLSEAVRLDPENAAGRKYLDAVRSKL